MSEYSKLIPHSPEWAMALQTFVKDLLLIEHRCNPWSDSGLFRAAKEAGFRDLTIWTVITARAKQGLSGFHARMKEVI